MSDSVPVLPTHQQGAAAAAPAPTGIDPGAHILLLQNQQLAADQKKRAAAACCGRGVLCGILGVSAVAVVGTIVYLVYMCHTFNKEFDEVDTELRRRLNARGFYTGGNNHYRY